MPIAAPNRTPLKAKNPVEILKKLWEKDKKTIIQQAVILAVTLILIFVVFFPLFFKIGFLKTDVKDKEQKISVSQAKIQKILELKKQLELQSKEIETVQNRFLQIQDLDRLVGDLSKLAADSGVRLVGSRPLSDAKKIFPEPYNKKYLTATYELTLEGGYHDFGKFFGEIEQSEKLLLVRDVTIQSNTSKQTDRLQCLLQVDAFVQAPQGFSK